MPDTMSADELRAARDVLGLSAEGLARLVKVKSGRTVRKWEAGDRAVPGYVAVIVRAMMDSRSADGLEAAIAAFKAALPGWWYSVCECQVSCDASCAPTRESEHIGLIAQDRRFDGGFHADLAQPATLADALRAVMADALAAIGATQGARIESDER